MEPLHGTALQWLTKLLQQQFQHGSTYSEYLLPERLKTAILTEEQSARSKLLWTTVKPRSSLNLGQNWALGTYNIISRHYSCNLQVFIFTNNRSQDVGRTELISLLKSISMHQIAACKEKIGPSNSSLTRPTCII